MLVGPSIFTVGAVPPLWQSPQLALSFPLLPAMPPLLALASMVSWLSATVPPPLASTSMSPPTALPRSRS